MRRARALKRPSKLITLAKAFTLFPPFEHQQPQNQSSRQMGSSQSAKELNTVQKVFRQFYHCRYQIGDLQMYQFLPCIQLIAEGWIGPGLRPIGQEVERGFKKLITQNQFWLLIRQENDIIHTLTRPKRTL